MNWHDRYVQQAGWTRDLRNYLFNQAGLKEAQRVLEVGCGTGAILSDLTFPAAPHGLDLDAGALVDARRHAPGAILVRGDALALPYADFIFDITYCHFLLLWVRDPLQAAREMARVTRPQGFVLALAEPDHTARVDKPDSLAQLGKWQTESLRAQGADVSLGARLAQTFDRAGIEIVETGAIRQGHEAAIGGQEQEWAVITADLRGRVAEGEIHKMKLLDIEARARGERVLHVPTYFALGRV
ncbi:MAG: Ubiquinone/menaquinone biosynthesis C-methyltransferase UbiE [Anaerolineales bacterium]|nr:Ubiquinone/menaquinone biosynthesis C-methyltransferase UbiE [Anaerolineales bacterium]